MPRLYSDNALMAKVKALYGASLKDQDYVQLLQKKSVGEVAGYLKRETGYARQLHEVREDLIHRGQLENLIRRRKLDIYLSLSRYSYADDSFLRLFLLRAEADQLLFALRLLNSGSMDQYVTTFPAYLSRYLRFDLFAFAHVRDFDSLLELLQGTDYYAILGAFRPLSGQSIDLPGCEHALLQHYYKEAAALIEKSYGGDARKDLLDLLHHQVLLYNMRVIYRLKTFFASDNDEIRRYLINVEAFAAAWRQSERLLQSEDSGVLLQKLRLTRPLRPYLQNTQDVEHAAQQFNHQLSRRRLRFSTQPIVVLMSFMVLLDTELDNIVSIIEGTRYSLPPDEIRALLVI